MSENGIARENKHEYEDSVCKISTKILKLLDGEQITVAKAKTSLEAALGSIDSMSLMTYRNILVERYGYPHEGDDAD